MKLRTQEVSRQGDKVTIRASWTDEMRRPANVKLLIERGSEQPDGLVASGDVLDVNGALYGLAEIAWSQGWRPRGLMGFIARMIETYKIPPESK